MIKQCHYCNKRHEAWSWGKYKKKNYCNEKWMYCVGCQAVHAHTHYMKHTKRLHPHTGEMHDGWWCEVWVRPKSLTPDQKVKNLAPGEVASGVHLGMDYQQCYGSTNIQEDFSVERRQQLKALGEAIDH